MRLVGLVVLLGLLGGCASDDHGRRHGPSHGPWYGPYHGPVYGPLYSPPPVHHRVYGPPGQHYHVPRVEHRYVVPAPVHRYPYQGRPVPGYRPPMPHQYRPGPAQHRPYPIAPGYRHADGPRQSGPEHRPRQRGDWSHPQRGEHRPRTLPPSGDYPGRAGRPGRGERRGHR